MANGQVIGTIPVSMTVDADNNYNITPTINLSTTSLIQQDFANQGVLVTVILPRLTYTIGGGAGPFTTVWERVSGLTFTTMAGNGYVDFSYTATANFNAAAVYRLKVTDSANRVFYSQNVSLQAGASNIRT